MQASLQAVNLSASSYFVPDFASMEYLNYGAAVSEASLSLTVLLLPHILVYCSSFAPFEFSRVCLHTAGQDILQYHTIKMNTILLSFKIIEITMNYLSQVEVNLLTGETTILRSDMIYDCGQSLNPAVDLGQVSMTKLMCYSRIKF